SDKPETAAAISFGLFSAASRCFLNSVSVIGNTHSATCQSTLGPAHCLLGFKLPNNPISKLRNPTRRRPAPYTPPPAHSIQVLSSSGREVAPQRRAPRGQGR